MFIMIFLDGINIGTFIGLLFCSCQFLQNLFFMIISTGRIDTRALVTPLISDWVTGFVTGFGSLYLIFFGVFFFRLFIWVFLSIVVYAQVWGDELDMVAWHLGRWMGQPSVRFQRL